MREGVCALPEGICASNCSLFDFVLRNLSSVFSFFFAALLSESCPGEFFRGES